MTINFLSKIKKQIKKLHYNHFTRDEIKINLWGLSLSVKRETTSDLPSELSVILPRAEYRNNEIILNSITVVLAPRHDTRPPR
jgi:hypothetical protein